MLEIDYALVPMSEADHRFVHDEVQRRVRNGELPAPERSVNGRLVLLNPDPAQTAHPVPDELRPRLRRVLLPTQVGSTHLGAESLVRQIVESDERLYVLVIELQSEFRALSAFLDHLPRLRALYPELAVFLSGTPGDLRARLQQVLAEGGATLVLEYGPERRVELSDAADFQRTVTTQAPVIAYAAPFFTELRLRPQPGGRPPAFDLPGLRKLHAALGHDEAEDPSVGPRQRAIVVELPVALVHDFRFRQDRGGDFMGVVIGGKTVLSGYFGDEKLEFRWVPLRTIEKFLRRGPAGEQEPIDMAQVSALRVNTDTGEVSFVMRDAGERVAVEQAGALSFRKLPHGTARTMPAPARPAAEDARQVIAFDRYVPRGPPSAQPDALQEAVRWHFYHQLIGVEVEQTRKRELYAQRLRAGAVGPLAGQTLKLLRRFGLERLIAPQSFYYLCDTPEEVPDYRGTARRYEQHFTRLVEAIRQVAVVQPSDRVRVADIAYSLPVSTEWADAGLASLDSVSAEDLEAVYQEMRLLSDFIAHEFRRNFNIEGEDLAFFAKMRACREVTLLARRLADFKRGAYGPPLPETEYPDVLFYATDADKEQNDTRYRFPSLACSELFSPALKGLFTAFDYDFSVFLEEQMALAAQSAHAEGNTEPGAEAFGAYFQRTLEETRSEQQALREMLVAIDDEESPLYHTLLAQEEHAYRERYRQFLEERERVERELAETTRDVEARLVELREQLGRDDAGAAEPASEGAGPVGGGEQRVLTAAARAAARLQADLYRAFGTLAAHIGAWRAHLERMAQAMRRYLHYQQAWRTAQDAREGADLHAQWQAQRAGRLEQLRRMPVAERAQHARRVQAQQRNFQSELQQMQTRLRERGEHHQRAAQSLHRFVRSAAQRLATLGNTRPEEVPERVLGQAEALRALLSRISQNAGTLVQRVHALQDALEKTHVRTQRHRRQLHHLLAEVALLRAVETGAAPVLTEPARTDAPLLRDADMERLREAAQAQAGAMRQAEQALHDAGTTVEAALEAVRAQALALRRFGERQGALIKLMARKARLRASAQGLAERRGLMEAELSDLPRRAHELFMPARKKLLVEVFLPEAEQRLVQLDKARELVAELLSLPEAPLKQRYLDHAIFRRFYSGQFVRGAAYAADPGSTLRHATRNVAPALRVLLRGLAHNFARARLTGADRLELPLLASQSAAEILATLERLASGVAPGPFDYLVLPPTLELKTGLALLRRKDLLFGGMPRLVLIFVTRFDPHLLQRDPELRDAYFGAVKHNVVLNIDGHAVVDHPRAIGLRLLRETLGCASDVPDVEEPPDEGVGA